MSRTPVPECPVCAKPLSNTHTRQGIPRYVCVNYAENCPEAGKKAYSKDGVLLSHK